MTHTMNEATIRLRMETLADGGFLATSADVSGLVAEGRGIGQAAEIARAWTRKIAESRVERGNPLPPALTGLVEPDAGIDRRVAVSLALAARLAHPALPGSRQRSRQSRRREVSRVAHPCGRPPCGAWRRDPGRE